MLAYVLLTTGQVLMWQKWMSLVKWKLQPTAFLKLLISPLAAIGPYLSLTQLRIYIRGSLPHRQLAEVGVLQL